MLSDWKKIKKTLIGLYYKYKLSKNKNLTFQPSSHIIILQDRCQENAPFGIHISKFSGEACPRTPLGKAALRGWPAALAFLSTPPPLHTPLTKANFLCLGNNNLGPLLPKELCNIYNFMNSPIAQKNSPVFTGHRQNDRYDWRPGPLNFTWPFQPVRLSCSTNHNQIQV